VVDGNFSFKKRAQSKTSAIATKKNRMPEKVWKNEIPASSPNRQPTRRVKQILTMLESSAIGITSVKSVNFYIVLPSAK
jgi:hypothetical protein